MTGVGRELPRLPGSLRSARRLTLALSLRERFDNKKRSVLYSVKRKMFDRCPMETNEFRSSGHKVVDLLADYLEEIEDKRVFPEVDPRMVTRLFQEPLPQEPSAPESVLAEIE